MSMNYSYDNTDLYDHIFNYMRPDFPYIWATLEVLKPKNIVEHGAGSGRLLPLFLNTTADKIIGLDIEVNMVKSFKKKGGERVESYVSDITKPHDKVSDASVVIITSSLMKHLEPIKRIDAWSNLYHNLSEESLIYIDHSEYIYGVSTSTNWQSYYDTLRYWWPEEYRTHLKNLYWKKEVGKGVDILYYKNGVNGEAAKIVTFPYSINTLLHDLAGCGFKTSYISKSFTSPVHLEGNSRFIGFASKKKDSKLDKICKDINMLANGRCAL